MTLNFGDGPLSFAVDPIDSRNADLLRQVTAFWLWGPLASYSCHSIKNKFHLVRRVFVLCSEQGVLASELSRFPLLTEKLPSLVFGNESTIDGFFNCLHDLYEHREFLGFTLLDREGLRQLARNLPEAEQIEQRAYIPPRIWSYQVTQLRRCLDDYLKHQEEIEHCYQFCLDAYAYNAHALKGTASEKKRAAPFWTESSFDRKGIGLKFYGPFEITASLFGIHELLERWSGPLNNGATNSGVWRLTDYLSLVSYAGLAYIVNFSLMRISEAWGLRADCLMVEHDEKFGDIHILQGETTKTQKDSDARWPTSPSVKTAILAMTSIAQLRLRCTSAQSKFSRVTDDLSNPFLIGRTFEPWLAPRSSKHGVRTWPRSCMKFLSQYPLLLDVEEIRITEPDLALARLLTPTIDEQKYKVGNIWPFSWHQFRRTGSVNMQSSGLVSDLSLQYQLKHATLPMALYYGQNHSRLRLNESARTTYLKAMYEIVGQELKRLDDQRFVSPHGEERKAEVLQPIKPRDAKELAKAAQRGEVVAPREIILGYCVKRDFCPWGGIDSIAHCGGGDAKSPCPHVLYDTHKIHVVRKLDVWLDEQLGQTSCQSPLRQSLEFQKRSLRSYLDVCTN